MLSRHYFLTCLFAVPSFVVAATAIAKPVTPDPLDMLRKEIAAAATTDTQYPIQDVLAQYPAATSSRFSYVKEGARGQAEVESDGSLAPENRPPDFTLDEWNAIRQTPLDGFESEFGGIGLELIDADEDGKRDLFVSEYSGGTGLFTIYYILKRIGDHFEGVVRRDRDTDELYSESGRGGNQEGTWIQLEGRVYLAYREGGYGFDTVTLERAFEGSPVSDRSISLEYRYRHTVFPAPALGLSVDSDKSTQVHDSELLMALQKALEPLNHGKEPNSEDPTQQCPQPAGLSKEDYPWPWAGAGYYLEDIVADLAFWFRNRCYDARLTAAITNGSYPHPTNTGLTLHALPADEQPLDVNISTVRKAGKVRIEPVGAVKGNDDPTSGIRRKDIGCNMLDFAGIPVEPGIGEIRGEPNTKRYFFQDGGDCPADLDRCRRPAYLVPGNQVLMKSRTVTWACVWFPGAQRETVGWMKGADIEAKPSRNNSQEPTDWLGIWTAGNATVSITRKGSGLFVSGHAGKEAKLTGEAILQGDSIRVTPGTGDGTCAPTLKLILDLLVINVREDCTQPNTEFDRVYRHTSR